MQKEHSEQIKKSFNEINLEAARSVVFSVHFFDGRTQQFAVGDGNDLIIAGAIIQNIGIQQISKVRSEVSHD